MASSTFDQITLDIICTFLPTSPSCKQNQIACCNRASNIAWRRMFYPLLCGEIGDIIGMMEINDCDSEDVQLMVLDMADIVGLFT
jgi:hypothetical protein